MIDDNALERYFATRDEGLRNDLCERHLPLVKFVARKLSANLPNNVELEDLVSWGALGLLDAIEKFDPGRGFAFSTYAVTRIRGEILDGLQKMEWAPKQVTSKVRAMRKVIDVLGHELNRDPTPLEIAARMGVDENEVRAWMVDEHGTRIRALDDGNRENSDGNAHGELAEDAEQEVAGEVAEIRARMAAVIGTLPPRERQVFLLYYRDRMTLKEIAATLGCSVSSATQTHTRLIEHVRHRLATYGAVA